jgi:hypothetical protein
MASRTIVEDKLKGGESANQYSSFDDVSFTCFIQEEMVDLHRQPSLPADSRVSHNPLYDNDAFIESVANAPTSKRFAFSHLVQPLMMQPYKLPFPPLEGWVPHDHQI